jgi:acyl-coenzyme A thioesterase PaaI-like protein
LLTFPLSGTDPASQGWESVAAAGNFMTMMGPIWRKQEQDQYVYGLLGQEKHTNHRTAVYGGAIMAFAGYVVGNIAVAEQHPLVTLQLDVHFLAAADIGEFMIGRGEIMRRSASLIFNRGTIETANKVVASIHGVGRIIRPSGSAQAAPTASPSA